MTTDQDDDHRERETLPPGPITEMRPPPPHDDGESEGDDPETWEGYNETKFLHRATAAVINGTNELLKARQIWDIEAIVKRQSVLFQEALDPKFQALATRLDGDIGNLRTEFEAMKVRMGQIEIALGIRSK